MTKAPVTFMYAMVMSRDTVGIALKITTLHDLEVKMTDILNA